MKTFQDTNRRRPWMRAGAGLAAAGAAAALYRWALLPWARTWGATPDEVECPLPGDEFVPDPDYATTHAITINAPADAVWPWLAQIGQDRGGFYSYDWLENLLGLDIHSVGRIVPTWQHVKTGDVVRMAPPGRFDGNAHMEVARVDIGRALVLRSPLEAPRDQAAAWAFVLDPVDAATTRLLVRTRLKGSSAFLLLLEPAHFIMEQKMMRGIKQRAERQAARLSPEHQPVTQVHADPPRRRR